jgi:hypothetical protein
VVNSQVMNRSNASRTSCGKVLVTRGIYSGTDRT